MEAEEHLEAEAMEAAITEMVIVVTGVVMIRATEVTRVHMDMGVEMRDMEVMDRAQGGGVDNRKEAAITRISVKKNNQAVLTISIV